MRLIFSHLLFGLTLCLTGSEILHAAPEHDPYTVTVTDELLGDIVRPIAGEKARVQTVTEDNLDALRATDLVFCRGELTGKLAEGIQNREQSGQLVFVADRVLKDKLEINQDLYKVMQQRLEQEIIRFPFPDNHIRIIEQAIPPSDPTWISGNKFYQAVATIKFSSSIMLKDADRDIIQSNKTLTQTAKREDVRQILKATGSTTTESIVDALRQGLSIERTSCENCLKIVFTSKNPKIAATVANALANECVNYSVRLDIERIMAPIEDLRQRTEQQLKKVESLQMQIHQPGPEAQSAMAQAIAEDLVQFDSANADFYRANASGLLE